MIGKKIKFKNKYTDMDSEGIVVDAWVEQEGSSKSDYFFGCGESRSGTKSKRMYLVEVTYFHTAEKGYHQIEAWRLKEILPD